MIEKVGQEDAETQAGDKVIDRILYFVVEAYISLYSHCVSYVAPAQL